jgi:predicted glycoside hydrolase/deacetylase ChbG (UPF0249 family)
MAGDLAIPLRHYSPAVRYCGDFYGQTPEGSPCPGGITVERLAGILAGLPPGLTELACHPAEGDDLTSAYRTERAEEVKTLCHPQVRAALAAGGIRLGSFHDVARFS